MPNYNSTNKQKYLVRMKEMQTIRHNTALGIMTEKIDTNSAVGIAIFSILASISQLERDLIADRVKIGLANARAKGKLIGRKKLRDSDLIRKLIKAKMSYRAIGVIAKCSHGSVSAERRAMKKEEAELTRKLEEQAEQEKKMQEATIIFPEIPQATDGSSENTVG